MSMPKKPGAALPMILVPICMAFIIITEKQLGKTWRKMIRISELLMGSLVSNGYTYLLTNLKFSFVPGIAIVSVVVNFNVFGDGLKRWFRLPGFVVSFGSSEH